MFEPMCHGAAPRRGRTPRSPSDFPGTSMTDPRPAVHRPGDRRRSGRSGSGSGSDSSRPGYFSMCVKLVRIADSRIEAVARAPPTGRRTSTVAPFATSTRSPEGLESRAQSGIRGLSAIFPRSQSQSFRPDGEAVMDTERNLLFGVVALPERRGGRGRPGGDLRGLGLGADPAAGRPDGRSRADDRRAEDRRSRRRWRGSWPRTAATRTRRWRRRSTAGRWRPSARSRGPAACRRWPSVPAPPPAGGRPGGPRRAAAASRRARPMPASATR